MLHLNISINFTINNKSYGSDDGYISDTEKQVNPEPLNNKGLVSDFIFKVINCASKVMTAIKVAEFFSNYMM